MIAPEHTFCLGLPRGRRASLAARFLNDLLLVVPVGDWARLFLLARRADSLGRDDKLGVLQTYARIASAWRGEKATDDDRISAWDSGIAA